MTEMGLFSTNLSNTSPSMAGLLSWWNCRRPIVPNLALPLNRWVMSLLIWEAIQFSAKVTKRFDFEGSMVESIERFFRAFGARQVPYFSVKKVSSRRLRAYLALQALLRP